MVEKTTSENLIRVLKAVVFGGTDEIALSKEEWQKVHELADKHDLAHLVEYYAKDQFPDGSCKNRAIFRYIQRAQSIEITREVLNKAKIPFILLKGSVIQNYYPESWMRTSSDLDVLVHDEDFSRTLHAFGEMGYSFGIDTGGYVMDIRTASGNSIELHRMMIEKVRFRKASEFLSHIWGVATAVDENGVEHVIPEEYVYLYQMAHTAFHFKSCGCGVRSVIDAKVMIKSNPDILIKSRDLLSECGLLSFAQNIESLADIWFCDAEKDIPKQFAEYILDCGVYGNLENRFVSGCRNKSRLYYLIQRVFPNYEKMQCEYSKLQCKAALPYYWLIRILKKNTKFKRKRYLEEIHFAMEVDKEKYLAQKELMRLSGIEEAEA